MPQRNSRMFVKRTTRSYVKCVYIVLGVFLALVGVFCTFFSSIVLNRLIEKKMVLRPGSDVTELWRNPDVNITIDFIFHNWTNPDDFYNPHVKPKFKEVGPYAFIDVPIKKIFNWHPENNTLDYGKADLFYFDPSRSNGSLEDNLVSFNALLAGAAYKSRKWSYVKQTVIDMVLKFYKNGVAWRRTADEFFFKGFKDEIVNLLNVLPASLRTSLNLLIPWDRISYAYGRNGSTDYLGKFTINTGVNDFEQLGQFVRWKDKNYTEAFPKECNSVVGSPGEFQKSNLKKNQSIKYFFADFCRSVELDYDGEVDVDGILGYRYKIAHKTFDNGTMYPENKCYCTEDCLPYGSMNIGSCWFDLPFFVSEPHFLNADQSYLDKVEGLKPNKSLHETSIILEPQTGFMLELIGKLQINIYIEPTYHISAFPTRKRLLFPVLWFNMHMKLSQTSATLLKLIIYSKMYCHVLGANIIVLVSLLLLWKPCKRVWNSRYAQHMEINTMADDDMVTDDKELGNKQNIFGNTSHIPSLMYITHPRRSLPIIINPLDDDDDDEVLNSCLDNEQKRPFEMSTEDCTLSDSTLSDS